MLLCWMCEFNPFTHAVELIRFAAYLRLQPNALAIFLALAVYGYDLVRGVVSRKTVGE